MEIIRTTALITINETLWVQMALFLVFLWIINRVMFRRVHRNMAERQAYIDGLKAGVTDLKTDLDQLLEKVAKDESRIKAAARQQRKILREDGEKLAEATLREARREIEKMRRDAEEKMSTSLEKARRKVAAESSALADLILERILDRGTDR
ncbi:MAG: ATP synthase F0 subunit B [Desulfobacterales bacterium]